MPEITFTELLAGVRPTAQAGRYHARFTADWLQGRTGFGGALAALAVTALRREIGVDRPLRTLMTAFVGPAGEGELSIECKHLRSGKSVTWAEARILHNDQVCTTFSACFGRGRDSAIQVPAAERPSAMAPEQASEFPFQRDVTPNFMQHFEMRWALGQMPVSGSKQSRMGVWIRFKEASGFGEAHVVALMDLLPPAVLQMLTQWRPVSSLTWHLEMLDDLRAEDTRDGEAWWFFHVHAQSAAGGYSQQHASLYTPAGRAIAMSQQSIAVFA